MMGRVVIEGSNWPGQLHRAQTPTGTNGVESPSECCSATDGKGIRERNVGSGLSTHPLSIFFSPLPLVPLLQAPSPARLHSVPKLLSALSQRTLPHSLLLPLSLSNYYYYYYHYHYHYHYYHYLYYY